MKKLFIALFATLSSLSIFSASSSDRTLVRVVEHEQPSIHTKFGDYIQTKINEFTADSTSYIFEIVKDECTSIMINYDELKAINDKLPEIVYSSEEDLIGDYKFVEFKYVSDSGFQLGYYVRRSKISWFLSFGESKQDIIYLRNKEELIEVLVGAQSTIEELMKYEN